MNNNARYARALVDTHTQLSGRQIAGAILSTDVSKHKADWLKLVAATRDLETLRLLKAHRAHFARHFGGNVIAFRERS